MIDLKPSVQHSKGRSYTWAGAELVNCFAEKADGDKLRDFAVMATPGLTLWTTAGTEIRGSITCAGVLYVVSGASLYSIAADGTATLLGPIGGTGPVRMAANYTEVCIAAGGTANVYSGGVLHTPAPFDVSDVFYADGYIIWVVQDSEQFFISALDDALTYDAADIASVEGFPDDIVGAVNSHRELIFLGENTAEIYYNSGAAAFPFERQGNAFIERGCFDRDSIVKIDNSVTFVGDDLIVYTLNGYQPQRISTHAIEYLLRDATYARAFTYSQEGHKFYCLECDRGTVLFDHATGAWHRRKSWQSDHWRVGGAVVAYGHQYLTARATGALYVPSLDVYDEADETISVEITLPTIDAGGDRATMYAFEVMLENGVGNADAPDPQAMLTYSDDGGHLWSNEMWRTMGAVGTHRTRAIWRRLGQFRSRQMRLTITDPVKRLIIGYRAEIS